MPQAIKELQALFQVAIDKWILKIALIETGEKENPQSISVYFQNIKEEQPRSPEDFERSLICSGHTDPQQVAFFIISKLVELKRDNNELQKELEDSNKTLTLYGL